MSILLTCTCGKRLKAADKLAGKRVKCTGCGAIIPVPAALAAGHHVFISTSSVDKTVADQACQVLEEQGIRCWIAPRDILAGMEWGEAIINAINDCRIMLLIFSSRANDSPQVRREVERAISKSKTILPLRIENVNPSKALEYSLGNTHWLDAFTPPLELHLAALAEAVRRLLDFKPAQAAGKAGAVAAKRPTPPAPAPRKTPSPQSGKSDPDLVLPRGFRFLDVIATTPNSVVVRALDEKTGQAAVIKRSSPMPAAPVNLKQLGLDCPHILVPERSWSEAGFLYEKMDWVEGCKLATILHMNQIPIRGELLEYWVTMLMEAIVPLHRANPPIIHRDITPANVMVRSDDLSLCLIDTTSACVFGQAQEPFGSPSYAPREQLQGKATPASDVYAVGALAYHLAMGQLPPTFQAREANVKRLEAQGKLRQMEVDGEILICDLPLDRFSRMGLQEWILRMLQLPSENRYPDAPSARRRKPHEDSLTDHDYGTLHFPDGSTVHMTEFEFEHERSGEA